MLQNYNSPEFFWAEAVAASVYIHNRILDKESPEVTAYDQIFKRKPTLSHARSFGCTAYVHAPEVKRKVLESKGKKHIMVGYDSNSNNYRLYDPELNEVILAPNASLVEHIPRESSTILECPRTNSNLKEINNEETEVMNEAETAFDDPGWEGHKVIQKKRRK